MKVTRRRLHGIASLIDSHPILWAALAMGSILAAFVLSRSRYAWLAASAAVVLTIPRSLGLDMSFLSVAAQSGASGVRALMFGNGASAPNANNAR